MPVELRVQTGDGTVPFMAALPHSMGRERLVCLRPGDFGYWEPRDRVISRVAGCHGAMPTMNIVHRLATAFLLDAPNRRGIFGVRPPGVASAEWNPPLRGLPERTAGTTET